MPNLQFTSSFKKNSGLIISPKEIREIYLHGIDINNKVAATLSDEAIEFYIRDAQVQIENLLNVKLFKQIYVDNLHFVNDEWVSWGFMKTTYPVSAPLSLEGFLNTTKQVTYPQAWLSAKRSSDEKLNHRSIYVVPAGNTTVSSGAIIFSGIIPQIGYLGSRTIPNYWNAVYTTGFDKIPSDILGAIGKFVAINLLLIAGDIVFGTPGLSNTSLSIDGLSQTIASQTPFGQRIKAYTEDLNKRILPQMKDNYKGIIFSVG